MEEKLTLIINLAPTFVWLGLIALFGSGIGFLFARKLWGRNNKRLRTSLEDSRYLASQWATMGLSQSQLVEKLGDKVCNSLNEFDAEKSALRTEIQNQRTLAEQARDELKKIRESGLLISAQDAQNLKDETDEVKKRDQQIKTLEARLTYLDGQSEHETAGHHEQVKVLLERINVLEQKTEGIPESELAENNRQLTELLKERCSELENLRDEVYTKHKDLVYLKQQNAALKKSVDEVIAGWSKKKGDNAAFAKSKLQLVEVEAELKQVREAYDSQALELEISKSKNEIDTSSIRSIEDTESAGAQIDILLEIVENRDTRVAELERQIGSGANGDQILALTQTIADLQTRLTESQRSLETKSGSPSIAERLVEADTNRLMAEAKGVGRSSSTSRARQSLKKPGIKELLYFGDGTQIREDESLDLGALAKEILLTDCQVSVVGFSGDSVGDIEKSLSLSVQRAELVRDQLVQKGVDPSQVIVRGRGADKGLANSSERWKANRVEIVLLPIAEIVN